MGDEMIRVRGAREHNLKNINVDIPRDRLTVITGLSGSGPAYVLQPTFGYLLAFILQAWFGGYYARRGAAVSYGRLLMANLGGMVIVYMIGIAWFYLVSNYVIAAPIPLWTAILYCGILQAPPAEIDELRGEAQSFDGSVTLPKPADVVIDGIEGKGTIKFGDFLELRFEDDGVAKLEFSDMAISGDRKLRQAPIDEVRNVRILVDTSVLEIFVNDGAYVFGTRFFEESDELVISHDLKAEGQTWYPMGSVDVNYLVIR